MFLVQNAVTSFTSLRTFRLSDSCTFERGTLLPLGNSNAVIVNIKSSFLAFYFSTNLILLLLSCFEINFYIDFKYPLDPLNNTRTNVEIIKTRNRQHFNPN